MVLFHSDTELILRIKETETSPLFQESDKR